VYFWKRVWRSSTQADRCEAPMNPQRAYHWQAEDDAES
jgi:hypothetical protein